MIVLCGVVLAGCAHSSGKEMDPSAQLTTPEGKRTGHGLRQTHPEWTSSSEKKGDGAFIEVRVLDTSSEPDFVRAIDDLVDETPDADEIAPVTAPLILPGVPLVYNDRVHRFIEYFKGRGYNSFQTFLERSGAYLPLMQDILIEEGLPPDLVYLALIESGFSAYAHSHASAVGYWQFIESTGRRFNLRIDGWVDERRDPIKATRAAAQYLTFLYNRFGDWHLAAAGYNAGEGRISRAIRTLQHDDYWRLIEYRHLATETRDYVPKLMAATLIARNPEEHGFSPEYREPVNQALVFVPGGTDLGLLAHAAGIELQALRRMNPELRRWSTPPDVESYGLHVPTDAVVDFHERLAAAPDSARTPFTKVVLKPGDSIHALAFERRISYEDIALLNPNMREWAGETLLLPVGEDGTRFADTPRRNAVQTRAVVRVRSGDTLWGIARRYNVSVNQLTSFNNLRGSTIRPGQRIRIPPTWYRAGMG